MSERLDQLIAQLAAAPADCALGQLEADIGRSIRARRSQARTAEALTPVALGAVGLAMAVGLTVGGASAAAAAASVRHAESFTAASELAPSTLLEAAQ
ncbi:MAG: hypothetical protein AB1429_05930 [Pseudomonadota bacterium]|jgi:hypothetical protein